MSSHRSLTAPSRSFQELPHTPTRSGSTNVRRTVDAVYSVSGQGTPISQSQDGSMSQGFSSMPPPSSIEPSMHLGSDNRRISGVSQGFDSLLGIDADALSATGNASASLTTGTPYKDRTSKNLPKGRTVKEQAKTLDQELGEFPISADTFVTYLYNLVEESSAKKFLLEHPELFKNRRWVLPAKLKKEKDLYSYFLKIIGEIIDQFVTPSAGDGVARDILDTHDRQFKHKEPWRHSSPDLSIWARGSSFETPSTENTLGYSNFATVFDVKLDRDISKSENIYQGAVYAHQILAHQPNRRFVRVLLISESNVRMIHYDRSGVQLSPLLNIHQNAEVFIDLIVGLCNAKEEILGIDTSIQWTIVAGKKTDGTLTTGGPGGKAYVLVDKDPVASHVIRGRATTCWAVRDPDSNESLIVKDSWIAEGRTAEHEYLYQVKGLAGVCEIVWYEAERGSTGDYRCPTTFDQFNVRIASRVIIKGYGPALHKFKTVDEVLIALRDAIAGHARIYGKKILHRDISNNNVLLGGENAPKGSRGVLIDLSEAINFEKDNTVVNKEARTGTRFFQSRTILDYMSNLTDEKPPAHDYLDDLEAFFYLLCFILLLFLMDGTPQPATNSGPKVLDGWDSETAKDALRAKTLIFDSTRRQKHMAVEAIEDLWGEACARLFEDYLEWVKTIQGEKAKLAYENHRHRRLTGHPKTDETGEGVFAPLFRYAPWHYNTVLGFFDAAIQSISGDGVEPEPPLDAFEQDQEPPTDIAFEQGPPTSSRNKRPSSPQSDDGPDAKLTRTMKGDFSRKTQSQRT